MEQIKKELQQHISIYIILSCVIIIGACLRLYHFGPWMQFELDQARDVFVVYDAVHEGWKNVPLLGPQARGRALFLGPIFYYFSIISGKMWGVSPETVAWPDAIFSILSIPLFFLLARQYCNRWLSVGLSAIVSVSLFLVTYGRFAWNPNSMFFWSLVTYYGLLRAYEEARLHARWFLLAVGGMGILTQLHFMAFIAVPLTFIGYMVLMRMRIPWKVAMFSALFLITLYAPVVVSEIQTSGANTKAFFLSVAYSEEMEADANTAADKEHNILERGFRALQESGTFFWHMISGGQSGRYHIRTKTTNGGHMVFLCDDECRRALIPHSISLVFFMGAFVMLMVVLYISFRDHCRAFDKRHCRQYRAVLLIFLWISCGGIFLVLVAYQISPRFYLYLAAPFFIMMGIILQKMVDRGRWWQWGVCCFIGMLIVANSYMLYGYFSALARASVTMQPIAWHDVAMNRGDIITLAQLRAAGAYINDQHDEKNYIIMADNRYARALYYIASIENQDDHALCYVKKSDVDSQLEEHMPYFVLMRSEGSGIANDLLMTHDVVAQERFGTIMVYALMPHEQTGFVSPKSERCHVR